MFVFADGESSLNQNLVVVLAVRKVKMRELDAPAGEFTLIKRQVTRITNICIFWIRHGIVDKLRVVITKSRRPLRMKTQIDERIAAPQTSRLIKGFRAVHVKCFPLKFQVPLVAQTMNP